MNSRNAMVKENEAPAEEQRICVECGFCCDGTLFTFAALKSGERGNLPEWIEQNSYSEDGKDYFRQPCGYFSGQCTIYNSHKAFICSAFRCRLLKDFEEGRYTEEEALVLIRDAVKMIDEIEKLFHSITDYEGYIPFRKILSEIGRMQKDASETRTDTPEFEMLVARCNILAALLIRNFREDEDFDKLVMK